MRAKLTLTVGTVLSLTVAALAQGTLIYDQQTQTNDPAFTTPGGGVMQQIAVPWGQSFTPMLSAIDFVRFSLNDSNPQNGIGGTVYINLRSDSLSGNIIATTTAVTMGNGFIGNPNFFFPTTVLLTPGTTYYLEPIVQSGSDLWNIIAGPYNYPGGSAWANGAPVLQSDFWFREGIIVPEPSSGVFVLLGAGVFVCVRQLRRGKTRDA